MYGLVARRTQGPESKVYLRTLSTQQPFFPLLYDICTTRAAAVVLYCCVSLPYVAVLASDTAVVRYSSLIPHPDGFCLACGTTAQQYSSSVFEPTLRPNNTTTT